MSSATDPRSEQTCPRCGHAMVEHWPRAVGPASKPYKTYMCAVSDCVCTFTVAPDSGDDNVQAVRPT